MADLTIANAATLTGANVASGDLFPVLDVSAAAGSQGSKITRDELRIAMGPGGSTNLWIPSSEMIPRVTTGCSINSLETTTNDVNYDILEFDAATAQYAQFALVMPTNWNAGTVTFKPHWTAASGSGDVIWGLQGRAFANDDALDQAFGTAQTSTDTLTAAVDLCIGPASSAITIAGSPAAGNLTYFQFYRDAAAGGDTLGVAAQLIGIEITFS